MKESVASDPPPQLMMAAMCRLLRSAPQLFAITLLLTIVADVREARAEEVQDFLLILKAGDIVERRNALIWLAQNADETAVLPILAALKEDADGGVRNLAENALWSIWTRSGDSEVDHLLKIGSFLMANGEFQRAELVFSEIIELKPDFAEGYNKRATLWYMKGEYQRSLEDIDLTLKRNPHHFGALSGAGLCLLKLERPVDALTFFDRALTINPNMAGIKRLRQGIRSTLDKQTI